MSYLEEYDYLIKNRHVITGFWITKEVENLIREQQDGRFFYDTREAKLRIDFMEHWCFQSKAPYYGKPFVLTPWEKAFLEALYSFRMADTNLRRFTKAILEIARKNGKSALLAGDGNTDLFIGEGGVEICCCSNDDKQSRIVWDEIGKMRGALDPGRIATSQTLTEIKNLNSNIKISRLSTKTQNKDGRLYYKAYQDESHDVDEPDGNCEIAEAVIRSMSTFDDPIFINCTTQGFSREGCYLDKEIEKAKKIILGESDTINLLPFLYEQDSENEIWQDEASWEKSNPSLRYGIKKYSFLRDKVEEARTDKAKRLHTLVKDFNIKQNSAELWLKSEDYAFTQDKKSLEDFRNCIGLASLDCSQTTDLTNLKILFMRKGDKTKYVFSHYWMPESKLNDSDDHAAGARYKEWAQKGYITICPEAIIDLSKVADYIYRLKEQYGIRIYKLGYDKAYAQVFEAAIDKISPTMREPINQKYLSTPMKWAEREFEKHLINHGNNPVDEWCLSNACCFVDGQENYSMRKAHAHNRIDGAITYLMLYSILMRFGAEYENKIK